MDFKKCFLCKRILLPSNQSSIKLNGCRLCYPDYGERVEASPKSIENHPRDLLNNSASTPIHAKKCRSKKSKIRKDWINEVPKKGCKCWKLNPNCPENIKKLERLARLERENIEKSVTSS